MKNSKIIVIFSCFLFLLLLGCKNKEKFDWNNIKFESQTIDYDTKEHILSLEGVVDGVTFDITPNVAYINPGTYNYIARVSYKGETKTYEATLIINKFTNILSIEEEQTLYLSDGPARAKYESNFDGYDPDNVEYFTVPGDYTSTLVFSETEGFSGWETTTVNMHVEWSRSGYFTEQEYDYIIGNELNIEPYIVDNTKNPESYSYKVENVDLKKQGHQKSYINIYDSENNLVESFRCIINVDYEDNEEFKKYADEMFVYFMEGDQISINLFMEDYEAYGLEHADALWYKYEPYSDEDYESDLEEIKNLRDEYNTFKDKNLSFNQLNTLNTIDSSIKNFEEILSDKKNILMRQEYVDQYGGYCADFPTYMESYSIRRLEDIDDLISFIDSTYDGFMSYALYVRDRGNSGYGLSKFTLESMIDYLDGVIEAEENYYLINVVKEKITGAKEKLNLSDDDVNEYLKQIDDAFIKCFKAHADLKKSLQEYIDEQTESGYLSTRFTEGYLSIYDGGKELYESILRDSLGIYDMSIGEYISYLDSVLKEYFDAYMEVYEKMTFNANRISIGKKTICGSDDPQDILDYLKEFAKTIVKDLKSNPDISVIYMDPTVTENTTTLAYYMKSALDSVDKEYIHLNGKDLGSDKLETINTLAHEGYPGHLYAYVYSKESENLSNFDRCMTCTGHAEGWAKYVEIALDEYIMATKNNNDWNLAMLSDIYWDLFIYVLYARMDVGIHYEGWQSNDCRLFLSRNQLNSDAATDVYRSLIEAPSQYAPYGYGMSKFYDLHKYAKEELGSLYSEVEFNDCILEHGWIGLELLEEYVNTYIENQKFVYHIA